MSAEKVKDALVARMDKGGCELYVCKLRQLRHGRATQASYPPP